MRTPHEINVYIRFCETDAAGHVNNTSHFLYFEEARTKFFKELYPERNSSISFILASIKCDYLQQAYAGQTLIVATDVIRVGFKSFTIRHTLINNETGSTIATADAVTVWFNYTEQKSVPIPEKLRLNLEKFLV
ncbi:thioesterase family protein [Oceanobacillus sp. J11TS1]|uniref:acyl-CoA thioesterase n=1 Tax=Oceanobacillus sp. J11TS1 TaxID=2807191 RepID=UPI001B13227F|nr:thioesterase family protein [Oceanobacillus sp. J11TS1]GIO22560.1 thioesterase [Oceanobacillus sp. J11TS1]